MNEIRFHERVSRRRFLVTAGLGVAGVATYGAVSNDLDVTHSGVPAAAAGRSGAARTPLRIALATDMHGPHNLIHRDQLLRAIADFRPHLLCVVGNAVDDRG